MSLASFSTVSLPTLADAYTASAAFGETAVRTATEWPFGWLNTLHWNIISNAVGFTPLRVARYLAPIALLYAQCYLLFEPGTRYIRIALGAACLAGMWTAWTATRFTSELPLAHDPTSSPPLPAGCGRCTASVLLLAATGAHTRPVAQRVEPRLDHAVHPVHAQVG